MNFKIFYYSFILLFISILLRYLLYTSFSSSSSSSSSSSFLTSFDYFNISSFFFKQENNNNNNNNNNKKNENNEEKESNNLPYLYDYYYYNLNSINQNNLNNNQEKLNYTNEISITAYLTSYIWYKYGISDSRFYSFQGYLLYYISNLLRSLFSSKNNNKFTENLLLLRHEIIDNKLHNLIEKNKTNYIIELASGLSSRGLRFSKLYGKKIKYIETDLPKILHVKYKLIKNDLNEYYITHPISVLNNYGNHSISHLLSNICSPFTFSIYPYFHFHSSYTSFIRIAMISEGLVNYFNYTTLQEIWTRIAYNLKECPFGGVYIFDIMILPTGEKYKEFNEELNQTIEFFSSTLKLQANFPYNSLITLTNDLIKCGFDEIQIINSTNKNQMILNTTIKTNISNNYNSKDDNDNNGSIVFDYIQIVVARVK